MRLILTLAALALLGQPASAQQAGTGWRAQTQEGLIAALQAWPGGWALVVRCQNGNLDTYLRSPVEVAADSRLVLSADGGEMTFNAAPVGGMASSTLFSTRALSLARAVRTGRVLEIKDAEGASVASLALGGEPAAPVETALTACGRPVVRPGLGDGPLRVATNPQWSARPAANDLTALLPSRWNPDILVYNTYVSCLSDGRGYMRDCELEWETPSGYGFGEATLRATRHFRIAAEEGTEVFIPLRWQVPRP